MAPTSHNQNVALHAAAKGGSLECIRFLLRANVPVDPVNGKGQVFYSFLLNTYLQTDANLD